MYIYIYTNVCVSVCVYVCIYVVCNCILVFAIHMYLLISCLFIGVLVFMSVFVCKHICICIHWVSDLLMSHSLCCCCCFWLLLLWRLHSRHLAIYDAKLTAVTQDTLYTVYLHAPCTHSKQVTSTIASEVSLKRNHGHLFLRFTTDRRQVVAIEPDIQVTWRLSVRTKKSKLGKHTGGSAAGARTKSPIW